MLNLKQIVDCIEKKKFKDALKLCDIYENKTNKHIIYNFKGAIYFSQNDLDNAEINFLNSFKINNVFVDSIKNLILVYNKKKNFKKSLFFTKKLVQTDKLNPLYNFQLGYAFGENHNHKDSIKYYKITIKLDKSFKFMVFNNIGSTYTRSQKYKISNKYYFRALKFNNKNKIIINNIFSNFIGLRDEKNAKIYYEKAKNLDQNLIEFLYNKAEYFILIGKISEAIKILSENKNIDRFLIKLIKIYFIIGNKNEGQRLFNNSKKKFLNDEKNINFLAMRLLFEGDFKNGWKYYDRGAIKSDHLFQNIKEWNGENVEKKHIVVFNEQGLGDAIQFSKYINPLLKISKKVTFVVKHNIKHIFNHDITNLEIITPDLARNLKFDFKIALGSLLKFFYMKNIKSNSLINNNKNKIKNLDSIKLYKNKLNVGLSWSGSFNGPNEPYRSIPLNSLKKIFSLDINYFCLQNEIWERDMKEFKLLKINNLAKYSLNEISSIIPNLDLVISADTSFLHLSSALNQETWGLLNLYPDWRWGEFKNINPYSSLRLFNQKIFNKWDNVEYEVFENLKKKMKIKLQS